MPVFNNILAGAAGQSGGDAGYKIERSLRFDSNQGTQLVRLPSSSGDRRKFTISFWVKRTKIQATQMILQTGDNYNDLFRLYFDGNDSFRVHNYNGSSYNFNYISTQVFRDVNSWMHFVCAIDTQASTGSQIKVYHNGQQITDWDTQDNPTSGLQTGWNASIYQRIGREYTSTYGEAYKMDGYIAELINVDGQQLLPTEFGEYDQTTGAWNPIEYTGTFGTNGFHLDFSDNSSATALGYDAAGSNNFTPTNISVASGVENDSVLDSPTNYQSASGNNGGNYCTMSNVDQEGCTLANGALEITTGSSKCGRGTFWANSGKWYFEFDMTTYGNPYVGIASNGTLQHYVSHNSICINNTGTIYDSNNGSQSHPGKSVRLNATGSYMVAYDLDNGKIWFGENGTWYETGGTNADVTTTLANVEAGNDGQGFSSHPSFVSNDYWTPQFGSSTNSCTYKVNFGQRPFSYPNSIPSGFKSLCAENLDDPSIKKSQDYFNAILYTGNGSNPRSISGVGHSSDLVWIKARNAASGHALMDSHRGPGNNTLAPHTTSNEGAETYGQMSSFDSDGFTVTFGSSGEQNVNFNNRTYVAYSWDAGTSFTNSAGSNGASIASAGKASTAAGLSIVKYTGNANSSGATVYHGLNQKPDVLIIKSLDTGYSWTVWHNNFSATELVYLNHSMGLQTSKTDYFNSTLPTSSVFSLRESPAVNSNNDEFICYAMHAVPGFSAFGKWSGGGRRCVNVGFRPKFLMVKAIADGHDWLMFDAAKSEFNRVQDWVSANLSDQEQTNNNTNYLSFYANGFEIEGVGGYFGTSADMIYLAFADVPFKYSRAR